MPIEGGIVIDLRRMWAAPLAGVALLACGEPKPEPAPQPGQVVLKVANGQPAVGGDSLVVARGGDTLVVRSADLVLREIAVKAETLAVAPVRFVLPLGPDTVALAPAAVAAGTYRTLRFEIYPPAPEQDSAFIASHAELAGSSVRVSGTWVRAGARRPFVFALDFNEEQEFQLEPALVVARTATPTLVLSVGVGKWFLNADSTALIDPATAGPGGANAAQVRDNVRMSFGVRVLSSP
jgi:hypothetical protein